MAALAAPQTGISLVVQETVAPEWNLVFVLWANYYWLPTHLSYAVSASAWEEFAASRKYYLAGSHDPAKNFVCDQDDITIAISPPWVIPGKGTP